MAQNNGYGNYDPRYDPRYQRQYAYQGQPGVEVRVPMISNHYNGQPQYQIPPAPVQPQVQPQMQQHSYQQVSNHGYQQPYNHYIQQQSPQMSQQAPVPLPPYQHHSQPQQQQQQHHHLPSPRPQPHHLPSPRQQQQHLPSPQLQQQHVPSPRQQHQHVPSPRQQQQHVPSPRQQQHHVPSPRLHQQHVSSPQMSINGHLSPGISPKPRSSTVDNRPRPVSRPSSRSTSQATNAPAPAAASPPQPPAPKIPEVDYSLLLIDLAEKYFGAAYGSSNDQSNIDDRETFCKLISTGLGCLEVSLREWKSTLQPSVEAAMRLRYASILYNETENYMEAEEALGKGITLCERYKLNDLKYNMQHLLTRVMYAENGKAALRFLDGVIKDVEAVQHVPWIYAMRFLRVSLALKMSQTQETLTAISQLKVIISLAQSRGDHAIANLASSLEALVHINRANSLDGIEQAQRALAAARSSQFDSKAQKIPQLNIIAFFVDLCCSIHQGDSGPAGSKLAAMQNYMDERPNDAGWSDDGNFSIPLSQSSSKILQNSSQSRGVIETRNDGQVSLRIKWLPRQEIYTLGYALSASALVHKNAHDGQKAERFLQEAAAMLEREKARDMSDNEKAIRSNLHCHIQSQLIFAQCLRSAWSSAKEDLSKFKDMTSKMPSEFSNKFEILLQYFEASILQGNGDTEAALSIYSRPIFALGARSANTISPFQQNLSILAALNSLLIIQDPAHRAHSQRSSILQSLEPLALDSPSKDIQAAYHLIRAVSLNIDPLEASSMLKTKQNLQNALQAAKQSSNNQLCCITLNFMSWKFFRGVVGEQPKKSALSGQALAKKGQSDLWLSVANGLLAETLETQGMGQEAEKAKKEALDTASKLPSSMQREVTIGMGRLDETFLA